MVQHHVLLVTYPGQGHINPALQFANRLVQLGVKVTYIVSTFIKRHFNQFPVSDGLSLVEFSDGYDDGFKGANKDFECYMSALKNNASKTIIQLVNDSKIDHGQPPIDCIVYTLLLPWAAEVAHRLHLQSTLLWIQPATVFDLYYHYFNGNGDMIRDKTKQSPSCAIELPNLPFSFTSRDLPSFFVPTNMDLFALLPIFEEQFKILAAQETNPTVLVNTFDSLELDALSAIDGINLVGIGPLIQSDNSIIAANLYKPSDDNYLAWLNSKPESSVVYVSFGSISVLSKLQMEELERGLTESGKDFLWIVRPPRGGEEDEKAQEDNYKMLTSKQHLNGNMMILPWCNQVDVLSHPSVGCFLTHCGWNSTLESLHHGVPMVGFPQWTDQGTNAMLVEDVWKVGVRVTTSGEEGLVEGDEIKRCLEKVMGDGEIRKNASKWKELACEAIKEDGSSDKNLRAFVNQIAH